MLKPFDFANNPALQAAGIGAIMQRAADRRAVQGLVSQDGQTHRTAAQKAAYDAGFSTQSREYRDAQFI